MSLIETQQQETRDTPAGAPETPAGDQQEHQRKARCNYL